jgi:hypothetical protein
MEPHVEKLPHEIRAAFNIPEVGNEMAIQAVEKGTTAYESWQA